MLTIRQQTVFNTLISLIAILAVFKVQIFFAGGGLLGYQYAGIEESSLYVRYIVLIFAASLILYISSFIKSDRISRTEMLCYAFITLMLINHFAWIIFDPLNASLTPPNLIFFISLTLPGIFAARAVYVFDTWRDFVKLTELFTVFMSIGIIVTFILPFISGIGIRGIGGASYQAASYYAAMCFGILGISTFRLEKEWRYTFLQTRPGSMLNTVLMAALFLATIINGGRGAFILLMLYTGLVFYWFISKHGLTLWGVMRAIVVISVMPIVFNMIFKIINLNPITASGFHRAIAFIGDSSSGFIDLAGGSSGRDRVYAVSLDGIADSPLLGYGAFGHWTKVIQPHNLFLDLALQFGVPIAIVITLSVLVWMWFKRKPWNTLKLWLLTILMYPGVMLMFSGGYFRSSIFWFAILSFTLLGTRMCRHSRTGGKKLIFQDVRSQPVGMIKTQVT